MLHRLLLPVTVLLVALAALGCVTEPAVEPAPPAAEPEVEPTAESETLIVTVIANSNVRTGPGTDHGIAFYLTPESVVAVTGIDASAQWLQIEHNERSGWIFHSLTDIAAATIADLSGQAMADEPAAPVAEPTPATVAEPTIEVPADEPAAPVAEPELADEPEPAAVPDTRTTVTVTGTVVNLRVGPGTEHTQDGQVREGDELHVVGRNADGSWLQIMHPVATGELVWIYGPLTDIAGATVQALAVVGAVSVEIEAAPEPDPEPAATPEPPAPVVEPPQTEAREPVVPPGCTRLHTVNPNETQLSQITDWFGLDLQTTAVLNAIEPDAPLTAGWQLCLPEAPDTFPATDDPEPHPVPRSPSAGGDCRHPMGHAFPCPLLPDNPERGHPNAGIGPSVHTIYDVLWHAPGTYDRDLLGLDHDFELVFNDLSILWDWSIRDFEGCYDALRVHMGSIPKEIGLTRLEFRLSDPFRVDPPPEVWFDNGIYHSPWGNPANVPWDEYPNWDPASMPPDLSAATFGCYLGPWEQLVCDIHPQWGNSHSIYLNAAVAKAMANIIINYSSHSLGNQYNRLSSRVLEANSYLFPLDDRIGDPVGHGPCADVWHAQ